MMWHYRSTGDHCVVNYADTKLLPTFENWLDEHATIHYLLILLIFACDLHTLYSL